MDSSLDFTAPFLWLAKNNYQRVEVRLDIDNGNKLKVQHISKRVMDNWYLKNLKLTRSTVTATGLPLTGSIRADGLTVEFAGDRNLENHVLGWLQQHIDQYHSSKGNSPPNSQMKQSSTSKPSSKPAYDVPQPLPINTVPAKNKAAMRAGNPPATKSSGQVSRYPVDQPAVPIQSPDKRARETYTASPLKAPRQSSFGALQQDHPSRSQDDNSSPAPGVKRKRDSDTPAALSAINRASKLFVHGDENSNDNRSGSQSNRRQALDEMRASAIQGTKEANRYKDPAYTTQSRKVNELFKNHDAKADAQAVVAKLRANKQPSEPSSIQPTAERLWPNENGTPQRAVTPAGVNRRHPSIFPPANTYGNRSSGMLRRSTNAFSSYGISFKDYDSNKQQYAGGVKNLGNTCYMGSVLQALFNLHPRYNHALHGALQAMVHKLSTTADTAENVPKGVLQPLHHLLTIHHEKQNHLISSDSLSGMKSSATFSVQDSFFASVVKLEKQHSLDPLALKMAIARRANKYRDNSQQDAQEFLVDLMSELEEEMLRMLQPAKPPLLLTNHSASKNETAAAAAAATDDLMNIDVMETDDDQPQYFHEEQEHEQQQVHCSTPSPATIAHIPRTENGEPLPKPEPPLASTAAKEEEEVDNGIDVMDISEDIAQQAAVEDETRRMKQLMLKVLPTTFLFESLMQLQMTCQQCGHQHEPRLEAYRDFAIDLQQQQPIADVEESTVGIAGRSLRSTTTSRRAQDLHHLLRGFLQPELRDLHCPQCAADNTQVRISKQMVDLAPVLVLQLKRFQYCRTLHQFKKVDTEVVIPKILDLASCGWQAVSIDQEQNSGHSVGGGGGCSKASEECQKLFNKVWSQDSSASSSQHWMQAADQLHEQLMHGQAVQGEYHLAAVVRHSGASVGLGHYICDVQTVINNQSKWLRYNDSYVVEVDEDVVLGSSAKDSTPYLLFYQFIP